MFKKGLLLLVLMAAPVVASSQLKVKSDGYVVTGTEIPSTYAIKPRFQSNYISTSSQSTTNCAIYACMDNANNSGNAYGVYGKGSNADGSNIGIAGVKGSSTSDGAGIYGCTYPILPYGISGSYAGFFMGNTIVSGTLTANSVVQSSDYRLKDNIQPLNNRNGSILDRILNMNVVEYTYKRMIPSMKLPDSVSVEEVLNNIGIKSGKKHIGLIAQELKEIFPTLVEEGQDGYLAVNYIELVPVLICAIQELSEKLDKVMDIKTYRIRSSDEQAEEVSVVSNKNVLYQNNPNPFKEQTIIRFKLADDVQDALICIFDMTGKTIKKLPISSGMESVSVGGYELGEGMFLYSLIVNGKEIDTKRMIISK